MNWNFKLLLAACLTGVCLTQPLHAQQQGLELQKSLSEVDTAANNMLFKQALEDVSSGSQPEAILKLQKVLSLEPGHEQARITLIKLHFLQKEYEQARALALQGTTIYPQRNIFWMALEDIYKETKDYQNLLTVLSKLAELNPEEIKYALDKAFALSLLERQQEALSEYDKAQQHFGEQVEIAIGRAAVFVKQKQFEQAANELESFKQKHPDEPRAYLQLAYVYLDNHEIEKALSELQRAEERFPDNPDIILTRADAFQQNQQTERMARELQKAFAIESMPIERKINILFSLYRDFPGEKAVDLSGPLVDILVKTHPENANAFAVQGDLFLQQQDYTNALAAFRKAGALDPKLDIVWENILQIQVATTQYKQAQQDGQQAVKHFPNNSVILLYTGYAYMLDKKQEQARDYLEAALNFADEKNEALMVQIYSALGDLYHAIEMPEVSNVAYDQALKLDSTNTYVLNNYAYYLSLRGEQLEKAAELAKKANTLMPSNASFEDTYAWVLFKQEAYQEALSWIEKALKNSLDPSPTMLEHKGDILFKTGEVKQAISFWKLARKAAGKVKQSTEKLDLKIKTKSYVE